MSTARESIVLVGLVAALTSALVAGAALLVFDREPAAATPGDAGALAADVSALSAQVRDLEQAREGDLVKIRSLEGEVANLSRRLEEARMVGGEGAVAGGAARGEGAAPEAEAAADPLASAMQRMFRQQMERQRERFIREITNPTAESQERSRQEIARMARRATDGLGLSERDTAEVERILQEVDQRRRESLRQLFTSKEKPEETTFEEVKVVLDESFEEEDRQISQSLPRDKADAYKENAEPMRNLVTGMAQAAFPAAPR